MSITWNGVSSDTIGVIVERIPNRYIPTRRFSPQQVAGRNGNILLVDKSFPNVEQEYEVYLSAEAQGLPSVARACAEWLMGPTGYCRLTDSYDTTVYREAFLMGGFDLENILNKFGRCTITFSCKPQKYLLAGDTPIEIPAGSTTTYTGSSVQFDGITGASITSLSATIEPIQDLHGYANPWPAGGGKNLLEVTATTQTVDGVTFTVNADGTIVVNGTAGQTVSFLVGSITFSSAVAHILSGCPQGGGSTTYDVRIRDASYHVIGFDFGNGASFTPEATTYYVSLTIRSGTTVSNIVFKPMIRLTTEADDTFAPYSNICPISGITELSVYVSLTQDPDDATVYNVDWTTQAGTVYGGTLDVVTGVLTVDTANIASYNGETITEPWISSMDAYATGTTPTIGAQVVYTLATPLTYQLTPQEIEVLVGTNNVWGSSGDVSVTVMNPLGGIVTNPTPFEARPMLEVSGVGEITINGKSIQILESVSDFQIDCEAMEAEDNSKIYCMDFPELSGGENEIVGYGSITALTVTPRWWTL